MASVRDQIEVHVGDITTLDVDAVVNAANKQLAGGGGVDGAIHRAAGADQLQAACREIGSCPTGEVRVTPGFDLPAKFIFHAVGPVWHGGDRGEEKLLAGCYRHAMAEGGRRHIDSIAFPAISCGVYGYPPKKAVACAVDTVTTFLEERAADGKAPIRVVFCCFDRQMADLYNEYLESRN